jgi:hypothetical protein
MDTPIPHAPTDEARAARIRWEAEKLAFAQREIDIGLGISGAELEAWLQESMATDDAVPLPSHASATTRP